MEGSDFQKLIETFSDDVRRCMEAGINVHILKPMDILLLEKIAARSIKASR